MAFDTEFLGRIAVALVMASGSFTQAVHGEEEIFRLLLVDRLRGAKPDSVTVVEATPLRFPRLTEWQWEFFGAPVQTLRLKSERSAEFTLDTFALGWFPPSTQLVPQAELQPLRRAPLEDLLRSWAAFRDRFGTEKFYAFSSPVVSDDGLDALVFRATSCGPQCGRTDLFWIHRAAPSESWSIAKVLNMGIS
jgi:hypothetical protein